MQNVESEIFGIGLSSETLRDNEASFEIETLKPSVPYTAVMCGGFQEEGRGVLQMDNPGADRR